MISHAKCLEGLDARPSLLTDDAFSAGNAVAFKLEVVVGAARVKRRIVQ